MHTILQLPFSVYPHAQQLRGDPARDRGGGDDRRLLGLAAASSRVFLPLARPGARHGGAVRLHQFVERVPRRADLHEPRDSRSPCRSCWSACASAITARSIGAPCRRASSSRSFPALPSISSLQRYYVSGLLVGRGQMSDLIGEAIEPGDERPAHGAQTIRDVARLAGVSIGTASKALNANGRLSAETRAKVLQSREGDRLPAQRPRAEPASRALDDGRHSLQRQLRPLHLSDRRGAGAAAVRPRHRGLHVQRDRRSARASAGTSINCSASGSTASSSPRAAPTSASRSSRRLAGCRSSTSFRASRIPNALCLLPDDEGGAALAVRHLAALGRKRIAHITGPERFEAVRLREEGYRARARRGWTQGARRRLSCRRMVGGVGPRGRPAPLRAEARRAPDALFCGNDQIARGAIDALREMGRSVPAMSPWSASTTGT